MEPKFDIHFWGIKINTQGLARGRRRCGRDDPGRLFDGKGGGLVFLRLVVPGKQGRAGAS